MSTTAKSTLLHVLKFFPRNFCLAMATATGGHCNRYNRNDDEGDDDNADGVNNRDLRTVARAQVLPTQFLLGNGHGDWL